MTDKQSGLTRSYRGIFSRAWPIMIANSVVPLLGLTDTAVIGRQGTVQDLGAIALGALVFSFVYWTFGFLRMGTTGFVAQASGAGDQPEIRASLGRALTMALVFGTGLIALQWPIAWVAFGVLDGSEQVESIAGQYFAIRIWGAPAALASFAIAGALIGLGRSRSLLALQVFTNGLNIGLDLLFAGVFGWGA
jgi:MATE family multidrug resistance protein